MTVFAAEDVSQPFDVVEESAETDVMQSADVSETSEEISVSDADAVLYDGGADYVETDMESADNQDDEADSENEEDATPLLENEEVTASLIDQTLIANTGSGNAGIATMSASGTIILSGVMPEGAFVTAEPVDVEIEGITVLAAYDITIYDAEGNEYQPQDGAIRVHMENNAIRSAEAEEADLVVYHMADEYAEPELIPVQAAEDGAVEFDAESFSIYVVGEDDESMTDAEGEAHYYYTVTFYVQDDNGVYQVYSGPQRVSPGEAVAEPGVPEVDEHSFIGWYTEEAGGTQFTFDTGGIMPEITDETNHTLDLYARYAENYYVYYHAHPFGDDSATVFHIDTYHDEDNILDTTEASDLYVQEGYLTGTQALIGWVDSDGYTVEDGTTISDDLQLYPDIADAIWIYFDTNGKDATVTPLFEYGDATTISDLPTDVTCAGYTFAGWYMNAECTGEEVTSSTLITDITSRNADGSITLYAKWEDAYVHYTVNIWRQKATDGKEGLDQKEFNVGEQFSTYSAYYDFAESIEVSAEDSTIKSDESISTDILSAYSGLGTIDPSSTAAYNGFEYNQNRTENELSGKTAASDGSTVINVYYDRVTITWHFWDSGSRRTDTSRSDYEGSLVGLYGTNLTPTNGSEPGGTLSDIPSHHRRYTFRSTDGNERLTGMETKFILRDADDTTTIYYWLRADGIYTAYISYYLEVDEDSVPSDATTRTAFGKTYMLADELEYDYTTASATHYYYLYNEYDGYEVAGYNLGKYKFSNNNLSLGDDKSAGVGDSAHLQSTYTTHRGSSVLYIYFDRNDYTVTLESNAKIISLGTNDIPYYNASATYTKQYPYGTALDFALPTPENLDGATFGPTTNGAYYEFTGNWYADPTLEVPFDWSQYETMPEYNLVAFAEWQLKDITVTFDSDGGSEVETQNIKATERATEPEEPTKEGYTFVGWQDTSTGKFFNFSTVLYEDIELKAVWQSADTESHPLIYDLNLNGIGQDTWQGNDQYETDSEVGVVGISTAFPNLDDDQVARFICWNTAADGTGTNYYPDETYKITGILDTLYARWAEEHTSTLTLNHNYPAGYEHGSDVNDVDEVTQDNLTDVNLIATTGLKHGDTIEVETATGTTTYRFDGWSTTQTNAASASDGDVEISADAIVAADTIDESAVNTLYAVWVALDPVTVTKVVDPNGVSGFDPTGETFTFTYSVDDEDDDYDAEGTETVSELTYNEDDGTWTGTFLIPEVSTGATVTVTETSVDEKYTTTITSNSEVTENTGTSITITMPSIAATIEVTNSLNVEYMTIEKVWNDGESESRPEAVAFTLLDGEEEIATIEMTADDVSQENENIWTVDLPVIVDEDVEYSLTEASEEGYTSNIEEIDENGEEIGFTVTNTKLIDAPVDKEPGTLTVSKTWLDGDADHSSDSITVQLYADGDAVEDATVTLDASDGWSADFTDLAAYDEEDDEITYTVAETSVPAGYTESYSDLEDGEITITNTKLIDGPNGKDAGTLTVSKTWIDGSADHSSDSIIVQLYANGDAVDGETVTLDASGEWSADFTGLEAYDANGEIEYTVEETEVPEGYTDSYSDLEGGEITITNTELYDGGTGTTPGVITVSKTWIDGSADHSSDSITVQLYANDEAVEGKTVTLDANGEWSAEFTSLPAYDADGAEITYTVAETDVPAGYTESYSDLENAEVTITNTKLIDAPDGKEPGTLTVSKTWLDGDADHSSDSITVQLYADGDAVEDATVTLDASDGWSADFTDLAAYDEEDDEITYTVAETSVPSGYTESYSDLEDGEITITNTKLIDAPEGKEPGTLTVSKEWNDGEDVSDHSNESITVQLYANGDAVDDAVVTLDADGEWSADFTGLAAYDADGEITYTVEETEVPEGYTDSYSDLEGGEITITNTELYDGGEGTTPGVITVSKTWIDGSADHSSDSITVQLYANDEAVEGKTVTLDADGDWSANFTSLPAYDADGAEITYTVEETEVPSGYTESYSDLENAEVTITNTKLIDAPDGKEPGTLTVSKTWLDGSADHSSDSITVQLYADGDAVDDAAVILDTDGEWSADFTDLAAYDADGNEITYTVAETSVPSGYTESYSDLEDGEITITNTKLIDAPEGKEPGTLTVSKEWNDGEDVSDHSSDSITVQLYANGDAVDDAAVTLDADGEWSADFTDLAAYDANGEIEYTVEETEVPEGYIDSYSDLEGGEITITNTELYDGGEGTMPGVITVSKTWIDGSADHSSDSITVQLYADGDAVDGKTVTLDADGEWSADFTSLPAYDADGAEITYTVAETDVPAGYTESYSDLENAEVTITNTKLIDAPEGKEPGTLTVSKTWIDGGADHSSDSITVQLYADGDAVDDAVVTLDADGEWSADFTGLAAYDADGNEITYTVAETSVPSGYTESYSDLEDGEITITNTKLIDAPEGKEPGTLTVSKTWLDGGADHSSDSITVQLYANGDAVDDAVVTLDADGEWSADFTGLAAYDADGNEITYTVAETSVPAGYTASYSDLADGEITITNTKLIDAPDGKEPGTLTVSKTWLDGSADHSSDSITIQLYANGDAVDDAAVTLDADGEWSADFTGLAAYDADGEISYTVEETEVPAGYTASYSDLADGEITITNAKLIDAPDGKEPGTLTVNKEWIDGGADHSSDSITIQLYADGDAVDDMAVTMDADGEWSADFTGLAAYDADGEITYTVEETSVPAGYTASYSDLADGEITITNTKLIGAPDGKEPGTLTVSKEWIDGGADHSSDSIIVQLYANGDAVDDAAVTLDADGEWSADFTGLAAYDADGEITYTVAETDVPDGYTASYSDLADGEITITNTALYDGGEGTTPGEIKVSIEWDDNDDQDGKRPDFVEVVLLADNEEVYYATISENNSEIKTLSVDDGTWTATFTDMPGYNADGAIEYTAIEDPVPDEYEVIYDENDPSATAAKVESGVATITNEYEPETADLTVTIVWKDSSNDGAERPESVTVTIFADGTENGTLTLTSADEQDGSWVGTVSDLPVYANGSKIIYTVNENAVYHYVIKVGDVEEGEDGHSTVTITDYYVNEYEDIDVTKIWDDEDDKDGKRPDSINVTLSDNEVFDYGAAITESDDWSYTFESVPKDLDGEELTYSLTEYEVSDYETSIEGSGESFTVTNTYESDKKDDTGNGGDDDKRDEITEPGPVVENPDDGDGSDGGKRDEITEPGPVVENPNSGNGGTGTDGTGTDGTGTDGTGTTGAKTADTNAPILYSIMIALAGAAIVTIGLRRRIVRR